MSRSSSTMTTATAAAAVAAAVAVAAALLAAVPTAPVHAWPGMRPGSSSSRSSSSSAAVDGGGGGIIGPACTVGAHNAFPAKLAGPCPDMPQPPPPANSSAVPAGRRHAWPAAFEVGWKFFFVPDAQAVPPYGPRGPPAGVAHNVTTGRTFYHDDPARGLRAMRETYDQFCIPVFGDPASRMGAANDYACSFINVWGTGPGATNTSYVVLAEDGVRPAGTPRCCVIGRPFHPPPRTFAHNMPVSYNSPDVFGTSVDWYAITNKGAGLFAYGFEADAPAPRPYAFYMRGVPWIANWMWQRFHGFEETVPPAKTWELPEECATAEPCPGWAPW